MDIDPPILPAAMFCGCARNLAAADGFIDLTAYDEVMELPYQVSYRFGNGKSRTLSDLVHT